MHRLKKPLFLIWLFHVKLFKYACIVLGSFFIITMLISALMTGALYYANTHGYLQKWMNNNLHEVHVTYQKANVSWHHGDPRLSLTGVTISDVEALSQPITLDSISVDFGIWSSLWRWNFVTDNLTISGLDFNIRENSDGSFSLESLDKIPVSGSGQLAPALTKWFLAQSGIYLDNFNVNLTLRNGQQLIMKVDEASWTRRFGYHFRLNGSIVEIPDSSVTANADLHFGDDPFDFKALQVDFNGSFTGKDFTPLFGKRAFHELSWVSGGGEISFSGNFNTGILRNLSIYVALNNVDLGHSNSNNIFTSKFDEAIMWQEETDKSWRVTIRPVDGDTNPSKLTIAYNPNQSPTWKMTAADVDIGMLGQWIDFWFPPTSYAAKAWQNIGPEGNIASLSAVADKAGGSFNLQAKDFKITANPIFPKGWPESTVNAAATWVMPGDGKTLTNINLTQLSLTNPALNLNLLGTINVPSKTPANPILNLQGNVSGQNLENVKAYYIPHINAGLTNWLMEGLVKLPKVAGTFIWQGQLDDMPYAKKKGLFQIALHVVGAEVAPWENWPHISGITGDVLFKNQRMTIDSDEAETTGVALRHIHFELADLRPEAVKTIVITGSATPTGAEGLHYLTLMPIITDPKVLNWLNDQALTGTLPVALQIVIPLEAHEPLTATGDVTFQNNSWGVKGDMPFVTNLTGYLHFVNDIFSSDGLTFTALNQSLNATMPASPIDNLKVLFQDFHFLGQDFPNLEMDITSNEGQTALNFVSPLMKGSLYVTNDNKEIVAHFNQFHLPLLASTANSATTDQEAPKLNVDTGSALGTVLSHIPALDLTVDDLYYGDQNLGQFYWNSAPIDEGIAISHVNLTSDVVGLTASGQIQTVGERDHFTLNGILASQNYGDFLTLLNYPGVMASGSGQIRFNLNWFGLIMSPDLSTLNGTLDFGLSDGKLLKINAGFARIFGLVSLDTIFSTLSLNFQKMMSQGLAFDALAGSYSVQNGAATADGDGVKLTGPSISLILKGQMDFANQTLNQTATVMPQIGNSIAIAATFVGGPIAGVATWFADKLISNTVLRNSGLVYKITGSFDKPSVTLFNAPAAATS